MPNDDDWGGWDYGASETAASDDDDDPKKPKRWKMFANQSAKDLISRNMRSGQQQGQGSNLNDLASTIGTIGGKYLKGLFSGG